MESTKTLAAVAFAAAALIACDRNPAEPSGDPGPHLTLFADSVVVGIYESTNPLVYSLRDASGAPQFGVVLKYLARDPAVAAVDAKGAIQALAVGSTYVVVTLSDRPQVRDSVRVRVHADSCTAARPDFGGPATVEDRALFAYDVDAPLHLQKTVLATNNGVEVSDVSFDSPDGGRVHGMMWEPVSKQGLRPAIVLMHGLPGNASNMASDGQQYAQYGGVVAIAIDAPWNRRPGPELTDTYQDRVEQITVVKDLQRAVDVLRSCAYVDAARIGFMGGSWGGATGALFVGIERRLKAAALVVGHGGQVSHATGPAGREHSKIYEMPCAQRVAWIRAMTPIEPIRFVGHANVPLLLQNGTMDQYIPEADAEELHAAAPQPKTVRWYNTNHGLDQQARDDRYVWFANLIGFD